MRSGTKRILICLGAVAAVAVVLSSALVSRFKRVKINFSAEFYYVCYGTLSDAVSASSLSSAVRSYGGAGYIIENDGEYFVAVACYYAEDDALSVCGNLGEKGLECSLVSQSAGGYSLSYSAKNNAELYLADLNALYSLSRTCYETANALDGLSLTEEGARAALSTVGDSLKGLLKKNGDGCFTEPLYALIAEWSDVSQGYILAGDVRRLQIAIADTMVNMELY